MIILETPRLALSEFCTEDAGHLYLLNLDPDVIRFTGDAAFESTEAAANFVRQYDHYEKYGFGRWAVTDKENRTFLGWCELKFCPDTNEHDIGFRFFKKYWNRGYATEAAKACLDHGFNNLGLTQIVGRAAIDNTASVKVLQKIGMAYLRSMDCGHDPGVVYRIENPNAN